jgi:O-antigen ligase
MSNPDTQNHGLTPAARLGFGAVALAVGACGVYLYALVVLGITHAVTTDLTDTLALVALLGLAIATFLSVIRRPDWGFYLFVFSVPMGNVSIKTSALTVSPPNVLVMTLSVGLLAKALFGDRRYFAHNALFWTRGGLFAWLLVATIISAAIAPNSEATVRFLVTRLGYALTFLVTLVVVTDMEKFKIALRVLIGSGVVCAILAIAGAFLPNRLPEQLVYCFDAYLPVLNTARCTAFGLSVHPFGSWVLLASAPAVLSIFRPDILGIRKGLAIACSAVLAFGLLISQDRGAWLAVIVTLVVLLLFSARPKRSYGVAMPVYVVSVVAGAALAALILWPFVIKPIAAWRMENVNIRMDEYRLALSLFSQHAMFGIGPLDDRFLELSTFGMGAVDNSFLVELAATGIIGFIPYLMLWAGAFLSSLQVFARIPTGEQRTMIGLTLVCLLLYLLAVQSYIGIGEKGPWLTMGLASSLVCIVRRQADFPRHRSEEAMPR